MNCRRLGSTRHQSYPVGNGLGKHTGFVGAGPCARPKPGRTAGAARDCFQVHNRAGAGACPYDDANVMQRTAEIDEAAGARTANSEHALPLGWALSTIGETGEYINGFAFKPSHWSSAGRPIIRIQNLTDPLKLFNRTTLDIPTTIVVRPGELLVSWSATLDAFLWRGEEAAMNQHIFRVVPDERLLQRDYLFYLLKAAIQEMQKTEHPHGSTMKHINRGPFMALRELRL